MMDRGHNAPFLLIKGVITLLYLGLNTDFSFQKQLVGATAAGPGTSIDTITTRGKTRQAIMVANASASGSTIVLETSEDGSTWTSLGSWSSTVANDAGVVTGIDLKRYVRANATTVAGASHVDALIILTAFDNIR